MTKKSANLKNVFKALPAAYLVLYPDLTIVAATDEYHKITRSEPEDLIGKNWFEVYPENKWTSKAKGGRHQRDSYEAVINSGIANTIPVQRYDIRLPPREGGVFVERWWRVSNSPVYDARGKLAYIIHAVEDITKMISVLEEAEDAIRLVKH